MHWPCHACWLCTLGRASSLTKTLISQSALCTFASAFTLVTLALCVKCRRTLKETLYNKCVFDKIECKSSDLSQNCQYNFLELSSVDSRFLLTKSCKPDSQNCQLDILVLSPVDNRFLLFTYIVSVSLIKWNADWMIWVKIDNITF